MPSPDALKSLLFRCQSRAYIGPLCPEIVMKIVWINTQYGGFQLEFVSISRVINHMTCYNSSGLIGGKFI